MIMPSIREFKQRRVADGQGFPVESERIELLSGWKDFKWKVFPPGKPRNGGFFQVSIGVGIRSPVCLENFQAL